MIGDALHVLLAEPGLWANQLVRHAELSMVALAVSIAIALPTGALLTRRERLAFQAINVANIGRTVPSLALLALVYPFVGTGFLPALIALVALGVPPILLATYTGVREVDPAISDAARGMGFSSRGTLLAAELPVAAPVILSGVRTAGVQVVASATLAALIGGGGLGELILAGLTNMRYDLLVAGALLVGGLAMATEAGFTLLERRGLPVGIRLLQRAAAAPVGGGYRAGMALDARRWRTVLAAAALGSAMFVAGGNVAGHVVAGIGVAGGPGAGGPLPTVRIGSKDFTEQLVLGELYAQALEAQGYHVERHLDLGATAVADAALRRGSIDLYPEYTGTALTSVLKQSPAGLDPDGAMAQGGGGSDAATMAAARSRAVYDAVRSGYRKRGMSLLAESPFSNGNAIVVTRATADRYHLHTISDLARHARSLRFAAVPGFDTREDGMPLLKARYGLRFGSMKTYEIGLKYKALLDGKVDAAYGFETDGQIAAGHLVVLADDRGIWPPYHVAPVVSSNFAKRAGAPFAPTIDAVTRLLDAKTMQQLNDRVDRGKQDPARVARDFLAAHALNHAGPRPTVRIGSKDFTEQFVLGELYSQALEARGFHVERHLNLGATAVADAAVRSHTIDLYPEYTGTALTAVLKRAPRQGMTGDQVTSEVRTGYAARGMRVLDATPFSNGNAIVVTKATADRYHLHTISDLAQHASSLRFAAVPGFDTREDGMPLLQKVYGLHFGSVKTFEIGLKYKALLDGKVDAVYGFETDGQIASGHLVVLADDRHAWPAYNVAPVVSRGFERRVGPDFDATLDYVSSLLDAATMQRLNSQVDQGKRDPAEVARTFLEAHGLG